MNPFTEVVVLGSVLEETKGAPFGAVSDTNGTTCTSVKAGKTCG